MCFTRPTGFSCDQRGGYDEAAAPGCPRPTLAFSTNTWVDRSPGMAAASRAAWLCASNGGASHSTGAPWPAAFANSKPFRPLALLKQALAAIYLIAFASAARRPTTGPLIISTPTCTTTKKPGTAALGPIRPPMCWRACRPAGCGPSWPIRDPMRARWRWRPCRRCVGQALAHSSLSPTGGVPIFDALRSPSARRQVQLGGPITPPRMAEHDESIYEWCPTGWSEAPRRIGPAKEGGRGVPPVRQCGCQRPLWPAS